MAVEKPLVDENITENSKELTKEELEARRGEITKYYEDHIPSLKTQLEYESLLRDIEKVRAERLQAQMFVQNTMAGQQQGPGVPPVPAKPQATAAPKAEEKKPKRTLKKAEKTDA
jgi:hypothetical protein